MEKAEECDPRGGIASGGGREYGRVAAVQGLSWMCVFRGRRGPAVYDCILTHTFDGQESDPADLRTFRPRAGALCFFHGNVKLQLWAPRARNTKRPPLFLSETGCFGRVHGRGRRPLDEPAYDLPRKGPYPQTCGAGQL